MTDRIIEGDGAVSLRAPRPDDAAPWLELMLDPETRRYGVPAYVPMPAVPSDFRGPIAQARQRFADLQPGVLAIVPRSDPGHFLGRISWRFESDPELGVADIGYSVHPAVRGRGVATAAAVLVARWLRYDEWGPRVPRVQLDHSVENPASCRVALAAGFVVEGVRRSLLPLRDTAAPGGVRRHDVCLHGIVADDLAG